MSRLCNELTVVCATTGNVEKIKALLYSMLHGTLVPMRFIVVTSNDLDKEELASINTECNESIQIDIIKSDRAGQVYQRNIGLARAESKFIIQLDDDLIVGADAILSLYKIASISEKNVVSPRVITYSGHSIYQASKLKEFLLCIHYMLFEFKFPRPRMLLMSSGKNFSSRINAEKNKIIRNNEWLPSCLMYWRSCLKEATTFEDHSGKGYYEDIIFTHSLFLKKYDLIVNNDAYFVHPEILSVNYDDIFKIHQKNRLVVNMFDKSIKKATLDRFITKAYYVIKILLNRL